jgi:peptidoglycan/xylan/chitin deacetylase (PgdA/CDA1 family)
MIQAASITLALMAAVGGLILGGGLSAALLLGLRRRGARLNGRRAGILAGLGALVVALIAGWGGLVFGGDAPIPAACQGVQAQGRTNLIANPAFAPGPDGAPASWTITSTLANGAPAGWAGPAAGSDLMAARIRVRPGAHYCYDVATGGSGHAQVLLSWDQASLVKGNGYSALPPQSAGRPLRGEFAAPAGTAYVLLRLRAVDGAPIFHAPALAEAGARVETWPDGAAGAFTFSFDWESAMGGLIHSQSQHDVAYATERGLRMRQGADILLDLFEKNNIQATFYATGYNLLDGNTEHRTFAGDPTYKWAKDQGWNTTWWLTNTWYSDDPYGTVQSDPAWYFGDQTDRLAAAGQEIGSHTFGHLYVRGLKPAQLSADMDEWVKAAAARGLPPVRSFAFPWRASNSVGAAFYKVLADHGIDSVTRIYDPNLIDRYVISAEPTYSPTLIMPDFELGPSGPNTTEGSTVKLLGAVEARNVLTETIARRGVTSFWTHPEQLTNPEVLAAWEDAIPAAAAARDKGDLWIASVSRIVDRWRDTALVDATTTAGTDGRLQITVTSHAKTPLDGVTLTLPHPVTEARIDGAVAAQRRPEQVVIPHLAPGTPVRIDAR